jgi:hypothetical protein
MREEHHCSALAMIIYYSVFHAADIVDDMIAAEFVIDLGKNGAT